MVGEMASSVNESLLAEYNRLSRKFRLISFERNEEQNLHSFLDELNELDLKSLSPTQCQEAALVVKQCCALIPSDNTLLVSKMCQLINNVYDKQQVHADGECLDQTVVWCLRALQMCPSYTSKDILSALEKALKGHIEMEKRKNVLNLLRPFLDTPTSLENGESLGSLWDLRLQAMQCIEALVALSFPLKNPLETPVMDSCRLCMNQLLVELGKIKHPQQDEMNYCNALLTAIKGVESIVQALGSPVLGDALGVVKTFMLYGLPGHSGLMLHRVPCASVSHSELSNKLSFVSKSAKALARGRPNRKRQSKKKDSLSVEESPAPLEQTSAPNLPYFRQLTQSIDILADAWPRTSDSEYSDTESGQGTKIRHMQTRVRHTALSLMLTITKIIEKKELFGYWSSLLPDGPGTPQTRTLMTCLLRDPSPKSRLIVLAILWAMLSPSRLYLLQAEHGDGSLGAFTPFSVCLGNMLNELHRCLCLALSAESSVPVMTQLLRVIAVMVQNTPYHRLRVGLLSKVISSIRGFVRHTDVNVQVAALTAFGCVVSIQPTTLELTEFLLKSTRTATVDSQKEESESPEDDKESLAEEENVEYEEDIDDAHFVGTDTHPPWILEISFGQTSRVPAPVRVERLQLIGALASHHFLLVIAPHFAMVQKVLLSALDDPEETIRLHAARSVETVGTAVHSPPSEGSSGVSPAQVVNFWQELLNGPLNNLLQSKDHPNLLSAACDCLASIGEHIFDQLPESKQIVCVTSLFVLAFDVESLVRASAVRALGVVVVFDALRKDMQFLVECVEAIMNGANDESFSVKLKASWALGNLSEALVLNRSDQYEELPISVLLSLLKTSRFSAVDNDKLRSNGVRASGNLLRLFRKHDLLNSDVKDNIIYAIIAIVQNTSTGSNMKIRWNACYAIGNVLKNSALYESSINLPATVFPVLCNLVEKFRNFKVRINAALALSVPECRIMYGNYFLPVWTALLRGIDNSEHIEDFNEYKHRDGLLDQICRSLCHLASLVVIDDLVALYDILNFHATTMKQLLQRNEDSVVPEHAGVYLAAANHAVNILTTQGLTGPQLAAAVLLQTVFTRD